MPCLGCGRQFHDECETEGGCEKCHDNTSPITLSLTSPGSRFKPDDQVTDVLSTGRKRAVALYGHLNRSDLPCEWRGLKNCGGGAVPIYGCINGFRQDIHHGPDKNTLNNNRDNINLICKKCHKRWHTANDEVYDRELFILTKHEPQEATYEELYEAELKWVKTPRGHIKIDEGEDIE